MALLNYGFFDEIKRFEFNTISNSIYYFYSMLTFTKKQIKEIAEELSLGFKAYVHKQTGEYLFVPDPIKMQDMDTTPWEDDIEKLEENSFDYYHIQTMESRDSFQIMVDFTEELPNTTLKNKLIQALNKRKPFREFKFVIDNSGDYRDKWFDFKNNREMEWVVAILKSHKALVSIA